MKRDNVPCSQRSAQPGQALSRPNNMQAGRPFDEEAWRPRRMRSKCVAVEVAA